MIVVVCCRDQGRTAIPLVGGVQATAENRTEAGLVARAVVRLRTRLLGREGTLYEDDGQFWSDGVFVVSPHHAQIAASWPDTENGLLTRSWTRPRGAGFPAPGHPAAGRDAEPAYRPKPGLV